MKFLLFTVLLFCAVKCDDVGNNYYVIEMPNDVPVNNKKPFKVYWNVPTMQCKSKKIPFNDLYQKYGIIQNEGDEFRGKEITILYEPGLFPAIFKNETSGKYRFRNGGVPQEGSMEEHLKVFKKDMEEIVPDPNFSGLGIIDFESWRPIFRQNFGTLVPYKDVSIEIEKKLHWWWPKPWIQTEAQRRFEEAARTFMQTTLSIAKQMRPKALWGYYGFPHCFNMASVSNMNENCPKNVISENDVTYWLWLESTALYPSVYSSRDLSSSQLGLLVRGRVEEAHRVRRYDTPILPYFWFRYRDGGFMKEEDLTVVLQSLHKSNASGFIIWGSSNDVNTESKCQKLHDYVERILGPTIAKYIQKINRLDDDQVETPTESNINDFNETLLNIDDVTNTTDPSVVNETINNNNSNEFVRRVQFDPEFDWMPPENYSQDISQNVEEELLRKGYNNTGNEGIELKKLSESAVADIIIDAVLDSEYSKKNNQQNIRDMENGTTTTTSSSTTTSKYTESPQLSNNENLYITEEPVNFTNKFLRTEIFTNYILNSTPKFNSETLIHDVQRDSEKIDKILDVNITTDVSLNSAAENKSINTFSDGPYNKDFTYTENSMLKENNSLSNDLLKDNQTNREEIRLKNINENMVINLIFNALIKQNIIDENNKKSVYTDLQNSDNTNKTNAQREEIYFVTTQKSIRVARDDSIQTDLGKSLENLKITKDIITDITSTMDTPITAKEDEFLDLISLEDKLSSRDFKNLSTELDDYLIVLKNYSEPKSDTTTQNNIKQIDYENNYLIILSVSMNDTTNANVTSSINDEYQSVDESTVENLGAISVNDSLSNVNSEESTISSQTESSTDIFVTNSEDSEHLKGSTDVVINDILSSTPKFNSESLIHNVQKDSEKKGNILDVKITTEVSFISTTENEFIDTFSDDPRNREFANTETSTPKENNSLSNYLLKENQTNSEKKRHNNINENIVMNLIFNALMKHNIIDENNKQSVYTDLQNSDNTKSTELTEKTDTQSEEIYFVTTQKSIREGSSDDLTQSDLGKGLENLEIAKDIITNITSNSDNPITAKEDESFDLTEDTLSNRDFKNSNTELDDFLIVLKNYTEPKSDTTTQNNIRQIDYENDYLIIPSVNMTNTTNANATCDINDEDQSVDESTIENLSEISESDSLSNINSEERTISSQTESSTDIFVISSEDSEHLKASTDVSEVSDSTTEPTVDQVVTYIYYV